VLVTNIAGTLSSSNALLAVNPFPTNIPVITSFAPKSGVPVINVTITGINFSSVATNDIVRFGAVTAVVTSASTTNLIVTVPTGATYAPITVTVYGLTAYSSGPFMPEFLSAGSLSTASFAGPTNLTAGNGPYRVTVGDMDGDGKPDVVVLNYYDGTIYVYRNVSTNGALTAASFASPVVLQIQGGANNAFGLALADLDGDGRLDIVAAVSSLNEVAVFQNLSSPGSLTTSSFSPEIDCAVGAPFQIAVRDVDGDGKPDIITANNSSNTVSILQNISLGGLLTSNSFAAPVSFATATGPVWVALADLDGDGKADIVTANHDPTYMVSVLRNLSGVGNIAFAPAANLPELSGNGESVALGDLDGDGKADIVVGSYGGQSVSVYRNTSTTGSLTTNSFAAPVVFAAGAQVHAVGLADLDGDGKLDVAVVSQASFEGGSDLLSVFKNTSTPGSFTNSSLGTRIDYPVGSNPAGIALADLDGDGRPDVTVGNFYDNTLAFRWYFNQTNLLAGATNASLTLTNVQLGQAGSYSVLVTNLYGSALSSNVALNVYTVPPGISSQPTNQTVAKCRRP